VNIFSFPRKRNGVCAFEKDENAKITIALNPRDGALISPIGYADVS